MSVHHDYETVIGLECHVQLQTASKLFSPARNRYGDAPNENVDVVDAGLPGVLPVPNRRAVEFAVRLGLALGCDIHLTNVFARKHYFYPDLPKGYQISQFARPICTGGSVTIETDQGEREVRLTRIHIEEDAGKTLHRPGETASFCDYNRAGTPLLEVVSEPDLFSADEAMAYYKALREVVVHLGICDGNLQEGSMRADANVSVRKKGSGALGQRTETKNLNSIRFLGQAIEAEAHRQVVELSAGGTIKAQTRLWDADKKESRVMREKEEADDYRYFPDPDLPPVVLTAADLATIESGMSELPRARRARYQDTLGLAPEAAATLCADLALAEYFEQAAAGHKNPVSVANWILNDLSRLMGERRTDDDEGGFSAATVGIPPAAIAGLVTLIDDKVISSTIAKKVFAELAADPGLRPADIVEAKGWRVQRDEGALRALIDEIVAQNPDQVAQYKAGKDKLFAFFVGQVMKRTKGQADPADVRRLLQAALS